MPSAKKIQCTVIETKRLSPTVVSLQLKPSRKISFEGGQFVSIEIPSNNGGKVKRCYSLANAPEQSQSHLELCVKVTPKGVGSNYLANLKVGASLTVFAAYGDFKFKSKSSERKVCFVATGTGIAPLRSIFLSEQFQENAPHTTMLFGARSEEEILYRGDFSKLGAKEVHAVSQPSTQWNGFTGRVTDYLRQLPADFDFKTTDFYLCGSGEMVDEARNILLGRGVPVANIYFERFSMPGKVLPFVQPNPSSLPQHHEPFASRRA